MLLDSMIIEVDGTFLGAAILLAGGRRLRFYAVHDSVRALHNQVRPDFESLRRSVALQFRRFGLGAPPSPS
ncbi:hypothetical protein AAC691_03025 [Nguyenibacter vanlangensis]|uniref:Uncharacterized protein n=1 Tax=Nguyenibacter vanlangensis TaxID=1216886 RepID=A0ABZ3D6S4_9PROT